MKGGANPGSVGILPATSAASPASKSLFENQSKIEISPQQEATTAVVVNPAHPRLHASRQVHGPSTNST